MINYIEENKIGEKIIELLTQVNQKLDRMEIESNRQTSKQFIDVYEKDEHQIKKQVMAELKAEKREFERKYRNRYNDYCRNQSLLSKLFMGTPTFDEYVLDQESDWG